MTEKLHFETMINAPVAKVWEMMLGAETYKQWTAAFDPSSYYEGSWEKGSQIKFLGDGGSGMLSEIVENVPAKFISIRHLGEIRNGVEDTTSEAVQKWLPAFENYTFEERDGGTWLQIDLEVMSSEESKKMMEMFKDMWPNALLKLKEICER